MPHKYFISIANDFSDVPGPREIKEGDFSAEEFRLDFLVPAFKEALENNEKLIVDLDGVEGYGTSFLEEAFGGLAREFGIQKVLDNVEIISNEVAYYKDEAIQYIKEADNPSEGD